MVSDLQVVKMVKHPATAKGGPVKQQPLRLNKF